MVFTPSPSGKGKDALRRHSRGRGDLEHGQNSCPRLVFCGILQGTGVLA